MADDDILKEARDAFERCQDAESDNRQTAVDDLRFARLGEQWPDKVRKDREADARPCLTINRLPGFIRQVVNDSRQNKPQVKVKPVDESADPHTADVISGLIRNIEQVSKADIAYDTAVDFAVSCGFGYFRIAIDWEYDNSFDKGLFIRPVENPFMVYGDPDSVAHDSSDWNVGFVTETRTKSQFEAKYKGAEKVDWDSGSYSDLKSPWKDGDSVMVAEFWKRDEVEKQLLKLATGVVVMEDVFKSNPDVFAGAQVVANRSVKSHKVIQRIMSGAEVLEENEWAGKFIPIIPVYGETLNIEGKRVLKSLIRDAKDPQRMLNYWRTMATETVALAPRVPFIGPEGAFDGEDAAKWENANTQNFAYLSYKGQIPPQRHPLDMGSAAGAINEAMMAADDLKSIMGMYDASLGQRSNETSGKAIMARQREGDVSTFHFIDNLARSIRHGGNILVDLIPKVYSSERMIRILGADGREKTVKIGKMPEGMSPQNPFPSETEQADNEQPDTDESLANVYDISVGRYDVVVDTGPGYTTRREEARVEMTEMMRAVPQLGQVAGDLIVKAFDWPHAEEISERIKKMLPANIQGEDAIPPELQQMIQMGQQKLQELSQQVQSMEMELKSKDLELEQKDLQIAEAKLEGKVASAATGGAPRAHDASPPSPVAFNMPQEMAGSMAQMLAEQIGPAVAAAVSSTIVNMPPLKVEMPRMVRTPIRDPNTNLITATVDEPVYDTMPGGAIQ